MRPTRLPFRARARRRPGNVVNGMNKAEGAYAQRLERRKLAGEIASFRYEPIKLRLAKATYYTPDFMVVLPGGEIELIDVKHMRKDAGGTYRIFREDDASIKLKVAAQLFPEFMVYMIAWHPTEKRWIEQAVEP
jgi:hypothetical protein